MPNRQQKNHLPRRSVKIPPDKLVRNLIRAAPEPVKESPSDTGATPKEKNIVIPDIISRKRKENIRNLRRKAGMTPHWRECEAPLRRTQRDGADETILCRSQADVGFCKEGPPLDDGASDEVGGFRIQNVISAFPHLEIIAQGSGLRAASGEDGTRGVRFRATCRLRRGRHEGVSFLFGGCSGVGGEFFHTLSSVPSAFALITRPAN